MARGAVVASWVAQVAAAVILAQTLYFKFTYAPETAAIFDGRGGRAAATTVGLLELAAVVLLLSGRAAAGAALALVLMAGAVFTHLTAIGVEVRDPATGAGDGGLLFGLALAVAACSAVVLVVRRHDLPVVGRVRPADPVVATR